jgi:hypothetical protein
MLEKFFKLGQNRTTVRTEVLAGMTTFLTMAHIIFVQPAVLSGKMFGFDTGMDFESVTTATCLSSALATPLMALLANYPIAQAPGMGTNFFFVFSAIPAAAAAGFTNSWQVALGVVFISGVLFLMLSLVGLPKRPGARSRLVDVCACRSTRVVFRFCAKSFMRLQTPSPEFLRNPDFHTPGWKRGGLRFGSSRGRGYCYSVLKGYAQHPEKTQHRPR